MNKTISLTEEEVTNKVISSYKKWLIAGKRKNQIDQAAAGAANDIWCDLFNRMGGDQKELEKKRDVVERLINK
ncbi:hypothetical protein OAH77_04445 [Flavobacteriaceae bacterium]|nr:hypothetical protein [Flavobacteriaceae bacterium]